MKLEQLTIEQINAILLVAMNRRVQESLKGTDLEWILDYTCNKELLKTLESRKETLTRENKKEQQDLIDSYIKAYEIEKHKSRYKFF